MASALSYVGFVSPGLSDFAAPTCGGSLMLTCATARRADAKFERAYQHEHSESEAIGVVIALER
jgi:hypothetical protein